MNQARSPVIIGNETGFILDETNENKANKTSNGLADFMAS